jgi:flagellar hook-length control protein FliK
MWLTAVMRRSDAAFSVVEMRMNQTDLGATMGVLLRVNSRPVEKIPNSDTVSNRDTGAVSDSSSFKKDMAAANKEIDNNKRSSSSTHDNKPDDSVSSAPSNTESTITEEGTNVSDATSVTKNEFNELTTPLESIADLSVELAFNSALTGALNNPPVNVNVISSGTLDLSAQSKTLAGGVSPLENTQQLTAAITKTLTSGQQQTPSGVNAPTRPMASLLASTTLPANQLFNKLLADNASLSAASSVDAEAFDIASAMSKEFDKGLSTPVPTASPLTGKLSADLVLTTPLSLNTSFQSAGQWGQSVTDKVMWMSSKGIKEATIQLDPPELGSLQVKVSVNQDQAQVSFIVQNTSVREALDQQSMRLREMFAEEGLNLVDVDVSDESPQQDKEAEQQSGFAHQDTSMVEGEELHTTPVYSSGQSYSLVDAYI